MYVRCTAAERLTAALEEHPNQGSESDRVGALEVDDSGEHGLKDGGTMSLMAVAGQSWEQARTRTGGGF